MSQVAYGFGQVLKDWRHHRRMSQLDMSLVSGVSQRHISFLETGRSRPSRSTVLHLAETLDVPLRERNVLLQSAGFAAAFAETPITEKPTRLFNEALTAMLKHHEPYPALVTDGRWNLVMVNEATNRFFGLYVDPIQGLANIGMPEDFQIVRLCLHDNGLKPYIVNWVELVSMFLQRARRALVFNPNDTRLPGLIDEITHHPNAPATWREPIWDTTPEPAMTMTLEKDGRRSSLFSVLAHFGSPQHVTLEELSLETFFPADETTKALLYSIGEG